MAPRPPYKGSGARGARPGRLDIPRDGPTFSAAALPAARWSPMYASRPLTALAVALGTLLPPPAGAAPADSTAAAPGDSLVVAPVDSLPPAPADSLAAARADSLAPAATDSTPPPRPAIGDTQRPLLMPVTRVTAPRVVRAEPEAEPGAPRPIASTATIDPVMLQDEDAASASDLGRLAPSTWTTVNSRGEALFQLRGASERHVGVLLDGVPLSVPWDERADLSLVPADALGGVRVVRGVGSVRQRPNAVAGQVELLPRTLDEEGSRRSFRLAHGEVDETRLGAGFVARRGAWDLLASAGWRQGDGFLLPRDVELDHHQPPGRLRRTNTQSELGSLLLRAAHDWGPEQDDGGRGKFSLFLAGYGGSKGVAPEGHVQDARFWRLDDIRRSLLGMRARRPAAPGGWGTDLRLSLDVFRQEIIEYEDATYDQTTDDLEQDLDRTADLAAMVERRVGGHTLRAATGARLTHHEESLLRDGPELAYSQQLYHAALEAGLALAPATRLHAGAGADFTRTPQTGDKPGREGDVEPKLSLRLEHGLGEDVDLELAGWQRARFPSLRELYSGALGRFEPNDDLRPERVRGAQLGVVRRSDAIDLTGGVFAQRLDGAIERVPALGSTASFRRANVDQLDVLGLELTANWRPAAGWRVRADYTAMRARSEDEGGEGFPEDRPGQLGTLSVNWLHPSGFALRAEGELVGERHSADETSPDGRRLLPAQGQLNLRGAWRWYRASTWLSDLELWARADNLLDSRIDSQVGLPRAGRMLRVGLRAGWGSI